MGFKRLLLFFIVIIIGVSISAYGQGAPSLNIQAGIAVFNDPANTPNSIVEFPFSVKRKQFEFIAAETGDYYRAAIFAELVLSDSLGNHIDSTNTYFYTLAKTLQETQDDDIKLFNSLSMSIKPGKYKAVLTVLDVTSKKKGSFIYDVIEIDPLIFDRLTLSSLELAHSIRYIDDASLNSARSHLVKNGREVIPNPMGMISESDSALFVYAELYNLDYTSENSDSFTVAFRVFDSDGGVYHDFGEFTASMPGSTAVITNSLNIRGWEPGKYIIRLTATDNNTGLIAESSKQFVVFSNVGRMSDYIATTITWPLDTASIETKTHWLRFIVDPSDWIMYNSLNDTGKAKFADQFFTEKDPSPGTKKNEYLDDVIFRFNYANDHFSSTTGERDGWHSDRGRVLLQYGSCNKIEDAFIPSGSVPLQVWYYYFIDGGVYFIFQDLDEFGNFKLVHSNKSGEIYDAVWEDWIRGGGMDLEFSPKRGNKATTGPLN